ncbi:hypothetical protein ACFLYO_09870, partial [Chloroflexota bacterium]
AAPAPEAASDPMGDDVDPLAWLESLAKRQGVRTEELITSADLDVPEAAADAVVDGPGYEDYSPFGAAATPAEVVEEPAPPAQLPMDDMLAQPMIAEPPPSGDDTLAWLEGLAAEQAEPAPSDVPSVEPTLAAEQVPAAATDDPLAGLSDQEIEQYAATGQLTAAQMEAWLMRQADSLAQARQSDTFLQEDLAPAEPAELPDWLQDAMPGAEADMEPAPLVEDIVEPPQPEGLPSWLDDETAAPAPPDEAELAAIASDILEEAGAGDTWVKALDHEYITQNLDPDEIPDWYQDALEDPDRMTELEERLSTSQELEIMAVADEGIPAEPEPVAESGSLPDWLQTAAPEDAALADVPDWLNEPVSEEAPVSAVAEDIDWLDEAEEAELPPADELVPAEMPDWLMDGAAEEAALPDWLSEAAPEEVVAEPESVAVTPPAPVTASAVAAPTPPMPVAPPVTISAAVPAGAAYDIFRAALDQNPDDHGSRITLARQLATEDKLGECLGQYETLIFSNAMLDDLAGDLTKLVETNPAVPQARRVLGDVLMRQGRLQDALSLYRSALEQL